MRHVLLLMFRHRSIVDRRPSVLRPDYAGDEILGREFRLRVFYRDGGEWREPYLQSYRGLKI